MRGFIGSVNIWDDSGILTWLKGARAGGQVADHGRQIMGTGGGAALPEAFMGNDS